MDSHINQGRGQPQQSRRDSVDISKGNLSRQSLGPSINPAILLPITSFPPTSTPSLVPQAPHTFTQEQMLQNLVSNLTLQHETVKQNMFIVAKERIKELRRAAQAELDALGDVSDGGPFATRTEEVKRGIEETMRKMKTPMREGSDGTDFEIRSHSYAALERTHHTYRRPNLTTPRTAATIRAEIVLKVQDLVNKSVDEIVNYENHTKHKLQYYRSLLEEQQRVSQHPGYGNITSDISTPAAPGAQYARRKSVSFSTVQSPATMSPGERTTTTTTTTGSSKGILKQGFIPSPIDQEKIGMMELNHDDEMDVDDAFDASVERKRREDVMRRKQEEKELERMKNQAMKYRATGFG